MNIISIEANEFCANYLNKHYKTKFSQESAKQTGLFLQFVSTMAKNDFDRMMNAYRANKKRQLDKESGGKKATVTFDKPAHEKLVNYANSLNITLSQAILTALDSTKQPPLIIENSQLQTENEALKQALSLVQNDFAEQGKLLMNLIREKKNLEINLALKANVKQKVESIPSPVKINPINPIKANPNQLQGISGATAKTAKVTLVIEPSSIPRVDSEGKKQTVLKIAVDSMIFQADLNSKSYRKAIATIDELGTENCNAILQGAMKTQGKLEGVGLVIQAKKVKEELSDSPVINNET